VSGRARKRLFVICLISVPLELSPVLLAVLREQYFGQRSLPFAIWYVSAFLLFFMCCLLLSRREGGRFFQAYVVRGSAAARVGTVLNVLVISFPIAGDLIVLGIPRKIAAILPVATLGRISTLVLTNLITYAISGVVGNFAYDVFRRILKPSSMHE